jgi:2-iminobutanoate/2-iminopropanoate deaminase
MEEIETDDAPASIGPFSQAVREGERIYVSGQGPVDPDDETVVSEDIRVQTERTLENVDAILRAADSSFSGVLKATVYVTDMDDYEAINEVYEEYLSAPYPARSAVEVAALPIDIGVEIDVIASAWPPPRRWKGSHPLLEVRIPTTPSFSGEAPVTPGNSPGVVWRSRYP